jgi:hypothetical protein
MTRAQALAEAERRWGRTASVDELRGTYSVMVGEGQTVTSMGAGDSWEAAFAAADEWILRTMKNHARTRKSA